MSYNEHIDLIKYIDNFKKNIDINNLLWKIDNIEKYNKFTQFINNNEIENNLNDEKKVEIIEKEKTKLPLEIIEKENKVENNLNDEKKVEIIEKEKKKNKKILPLEIIEKEKKENKKILPLNLICNYSNLIDTIDNVKIIKEKLIEKITNQNYIKVFGRKASSEILKNLIENKWNKSLVIFISFLFEIKIIYLKKEILFIKELKNYKTITL